MSAPYYADESVTLHHGDCLDVLRAMPDNSVEAIVTDPPYGLGFMGKDWDDLPPGLPWSQECLRVLKPGGHLLAFGGTRTWHRLAVAVEDAGFEMRDSIAWLYGSGFPKSLDVSKAIDKAAGATRTEVLGRRWEENRKPGIKAAGILGELGADDGLITAPATDDARRWQGWGTALKPAFEPVVVARKPLVGTVAANVLAHGTGALNIDACRVGTTGGGTTCGHRDDAGKCLGHGNAGRSTSGETFHGAESSGGRWPANVVLDEDAAAELDRQSGNRPGMSTQRDLTTTESAYFGADKHPGVREGFNDSGGASRFFKVVPAFDALCEHDPPHIACSSADPFGDWPSPHPDRCGGSVLCSICGGNDLAETFRYVAKAPTRERPTADDGTRHPTVKPLALMRWLVRLVTPPGGVVLEPFAGSGTTVEACLLEGFDCIAIEREADYLPLIEQRIRRVAVDPPAPPNPPSLFDDIDQGDAA